MTFINPCNKCLVKATCNVKHTCNNFHNYRSGMLFLIPFMKVLYSIAVVTTPFVGWLYGMKEEYHQSELASIIYSLSCMTILISLFFLMMKINQKVRKLID